jgi:beta-glucosidase
LDQLDKTEKRYRFPQGFLWGAATSSHQVEGNNRWNDWWHYEQTGRLPHRSGEACRHYELYEQDFDLARSWGHNAHRFSIEWSRIEPEEGRWNDVELAHYQAVVRALRQRGLEPVVTLYHFTNPLWFAKGGGWLRRDSVRCFARYVAHAVGQLKDEVRYWVTINEPTVHLKYGYVTGDWPPFLTGAWDKATRAFHQLARAHRAGYEVVHENAPQARVGFAHSAPWIVPCDERNARDRTAAWLRDFALNRSFFHLIGASRSLDFIGLNYYSRTIVRSGSRGLATPFGQECLLDHHNDRGPLSATGWEVYPRGLKAVLKKFSTLGLPLMVTENGIATDDEGLRHAFVAGHLRALAEALAEGIDVLGYFYWSLMDNFEWALGTAPRYGLAAVDFRTQARLPRPCVEYFASVCHSNTLSLPSQADGVGKR